MFTLEALDAAHGDALLLRFDGAAGERQILIDGGPSGIYAKSVKPRLDELRAGLPADSPLAIDLVMISHIDDDHIRGILELTDALEEVAAAQEPAPYRVGGLWLNAFRADELVPAADDAALGAALAASTSVNAASVGPESAAVVASIPQGNDLVDAAVVLNIPRNADFGSGRAMAEATGPVNVDMGDGLGLAVVGPNEDRIDDLRAKWEAYEEKLRQKAAKAKIAAAAADVDRSVYNLSSIVVLARKGDRTMLLTGDALGRDVLQFLEGGGLMPQGSLHVDLFKMPHHGSIRNVSKPPDLLRRITADHYVISADGTNGNPDIPTLELLTAARGTDAYTIHLTNREPRVEAFFVADKAANDRHYDVDFRADGDLAVVIPLDG